MRIFNRLAGLETEYAIRIERAGLPGAPSRFRIFQTLISTVGRRILTVEAKHFKDGVFLANGGALWFDGDRPCAGGGLIEGATPECRGPKQLLTYQRAQDRLLREAAQRSPERISLLKNDRDAFGNVYGLQENYECDVASGWRLLAWRIGVLLLLPLTLLWGFFFAATVALLFIYMGIASLLCWILGLSDTDLARRLLGQDWIEGQPTGKPAPAWLETLTLYSTRLCTAPIACALVLLTKTLAFRRIRRDLTAFLVTRTIYAGAGSLRNDGRFEVADKGQAMNCVLGVGRFIQDRPIYVVAHFFKTLYVEFFSSPREFLTLLNRKQRLQIAIGDSNMAEPAEYLKIGATMLVLDAIEAGAIQDAPRLRNPIAALRAVCADTQLNSCLRLRRRPAKTAIEIQRNYLSQCRRFVEADPEAPVEAHEIIALWDRALTLLEQKRDEGKSPRELLGMLDWVTKQWLLDNVTPAASTAATEALVPSVQSECEVAACGGYSTTLWRAAKKVDLRYAELSENGYFALMSDAGFENARADLEDVDRAMRLPPPNSPATMRGHYIREFAAGSETITVNWKTIVIGRGRDRRVIALRHYDNASPRPDPRRSPKTPVQ